MTLLTAHRILIGTAIGFFTFYAFWEFGGRAGSGAAAGSWRGGLSLVAAAVLGIYFSTLTGRRGAGDDRGNP